MRNLYRQLGVSVDATPEQIKAAYRAQARKVHPDHGGDAARFRELLAVYEVLRDPARRKDYDRQFLDALDVPGAELCEACGGIVDPSRVAACPYCRADLPMSMAARFSARVYDLAADLGDRATNHTRDLLVDALDLGAQALRNRLFKRRAR